MALERNQRAVGDGLMSQSARINYSTPTANATVQIELYQKANIYDLAANVAITAKLPPVVEAIGEFYTFRVPDSGSGTGLTLTASDATNWTNIVLDADNDHCMLYSDGEKWFVVVDGVA